MIPLLIGSTSAGEQTRIQMMRTRTPPPLVGETLEMFGGGLGTKTSPQRNPWKIIGRREWDISTPPLTMAHARGKRAPSRTFVRFYYTDRRSRGRPVGFPPSNTPIPPPLSQGGPEVGSYQTHPPTPAMGNGGWVAQGGGGYSSGPPPATGLGSLVLSDDAIHAFAVALQGVVVTGVVAALIYPSHAVPAVRVVNLLILHLRFDCRVAGYGDLHLIWELVVQGKFRMEGLATLNQTPMRGLPYCLQVFGRRVHFTPPPPSPCVCEERFAVELLPITSLLWGGVHSMYDTPGDD